MNQPGQAGPVLRALQRVFKHASQVEQEEFPAVVTAFLLFFCVLGGYFAVRPVRETVGTILGADRVSDLYVVTWIAAVAIVPAYGMLCARYQRSAFLPWIYGFVAIALATVGTVFLTHRENSVAVGQFFYVMISVLNLFVVSVFWSFLLEVFTTDQTKRLFPAIAAGGTAGALAGPFLTDILVGFIGNAGILYFGASLFVVAIICQRVLLRIWTTGGAAGVHAQDRPMGGNPFAGFTLILKSPYLLGIAMFVILLASANTLLYFEQLNLVATTFPDTVTRTQVFSRLDYTVQTLTIMAQFLITGRVAKKWGVIPLVTIVPLIMIIAFVSLATFYSFGVLAVAMVARRVGEYAFVRPGREMLFGGLDNETKYKAKTTIDVPVYRGGDALSAQVDNALQSGGLSPQNVAMMGAGLCAVWAFNGLLIGRQREAMEARPARPAPAGA
ncbi:MAG: NTP/NDP exchange transporter [Longimicrobiales bacterium]